MWTFTGNNLTVGGDLMRRLVWIHLVPETDHPERIPAEQFRHDDLLGWVRGERANLVAAEFTLGRAWLAAGRPMPDAPPLGSFEVWRATIGGILGIAGVKGFLGKSSAAARVQRDESSEGWGVVFAALADATELGPQTAGELLFYLGGLELDEAPHELATLMDCLEKSPNSARQGAGYLFRSLAGGSLGTTDRSFVCFEYVNAKVVGRLNTKFGGCALEHAAHFCHKARFRARA